MKFLHSVNDYTRLNKLSNEGTGDELNTSFSVNDRIQHKQNWINRMDERRIPKLALKYKLLGKKDTGRLFKEGFVVGTYQLAL